MPVHHFTCAAGHDRNPESKLHDGRSHPVYRPTWAAADIWTAADIFVSLSDNIQETFGLTPTLVAIDRMEKAGSVRVVTA